MGAELLACDLDGTILGATLALDPELVAAFRRAQARGLAITIATGRMPLSVDRYREELGIGVPVVYYNGALVRDAAGPHLLALDLPRGVLADVLDVFAAAPVHPIFFRDEQLHCLHRTLAVRQFCDDEGLRANEISDPSDFLRLGGFTKALFIGDPRDLAVVRADLAGVIGPGARLVRTADCYLELLPAAATKGAALTWLAAHLGIALDRVAAVGDQDNDLEMIRAAGLGIAMPHAPDEVRAAADRVAHVPEAGGLLRTLAELLPEFFEPAPSASAAI